MLIFTLLSLAFAQNHEPETNVQSVNFDGVALKGVLRALRQVGRDRPPRHVARGRVGVLVDGQHVEDADGDVGRRRAVLVPRANRVPHAVLRLHRRPVNDAAVLRGPKEEEE